MKCILKLSKTIVSVLVTACIQFIFVNISTAQWQPDLRLTNDPALSITNYNIPCISTSGDTLHVVWFDERDGNREIYYMRSTDSGVNWGTSTRLTNSAGSSENPTITVEGSVVHVVWHDSRDGNNEIYYKRSGDGGVSWGTDVRLTNATNQSRWPSISTTGSDVHIAWFDERDGNQEIYYIRSTDGGLSWGTDVRLTNDPNGSGWSSVVASGSAVHIVWGDDRFGAEIFYKRSTDGGITWGSDTRLTNDPGFSAYSWVSLSGSVLHIVWMDTRDGNREIYYKRTTDSGISWGSDQRMTNNSSASEWPSVSASGMIVHVVWYDLRDGNSEIYYKRSTDSGISWGTDTRLTNNSSASQWTSVKASGTNVHILWYDLRDGNGEIYYKQNPIGNTLTTVDSVSPYNKVSVPLNSDMKAYFNQSMNSSTMDTASIIFFGSMTGRKQAGITYNSGDRSVAINPNNDFKYGELISAILKSSIKSSTDNFMTPFVWSFTSLANPSNMVFNEISNIAVGTNPYSVASGDLDNDGDIDLAVANSAGSISIIINNGNGTFTKQNPDIISGDTRRVIAGDFDNDGDLDLAAGIGSLSSVKILTNNGNGVFTITSTVPSGNCHDLTTADFNGDGYLDIATSGWTENKIGILLNNRSGSFTLSSVITAGSGVYEVVAGDFDSDGFIDIAAPNYYGNNCSIYRNNGTGNFMTLSSVGVGSSPQGITVGDFDSDGDLDLSVTNYGSNNLNILMNNGNGSFISTAAIGTGANPWGINCADLDGDGDLDLAVCAGSTVYLYRNGGNGNFTFSSYAGQYGIPAPRTTVADFNNDGVLDIATADITANKTRIIVSLVSPQLLSPANNSTGNLNALSFSWNKPLSAANYRFQLATDSLFSNIIVNDSTLIGLDSVKNVSGLSMLTWYYWRLNSKSANGSSLWSDVWKFKTIGLPYKVTLIGPPNNAVNQPVTVNFWWSRAVEQTSPFENKKLAGKEDGVVDAISNYWFEIVTDTSSMTNLMRDTTLTDTTKIVGGLANLTGYFWRVKAKGEFGWGNYSVWFRFTTIISAPSAPVLVTPANGATGQNITLRLVWNRLQTAETYKLQVSADSLFNVLIVNDSNVTDSARVISGLSPLTYYWWRVNAKNIGGTGIYSNIWKFKTMGAPTQVTLITPPNNATNQAINLNFVWSRSVDLLAPWLDVNKNGEGMYENESISSYWFDLVTDTSSMSNLLRDTSLTDTSKAVSGLSYSTAYYWRVKAKNQIGWGVYSVWFRFTTGPLPPANVNLTVIPGGFYDVGSGRLNMKDTIRVYLVDSVSCLRVDSAKGVIDSVTYSMPISFSNASTGNYYMMVYHRNHLAIASRYSQGIIRGSTVSYDFTTDSTKTFGFNVVKVSTSPVRWAMIPADANRDGFVDATDQLVWINLNGLDGYLDADFNGDSFVDATDQLIWITYNGTSVFLPCGFVLDPVTGNLITNRPDYDAKKGSRMLFEKKKQSEKIQTDTKQNNLRK